MVMMVHFPLRASNIHFSAHRLAGDMNGETASSLAALFWDASIRRVFAVSVSAIAAVSFYGDFIPSDGSSFFAPSLQFTSDVRGVEGGHPVQGAMYK